MIYDKISLRYIPSKELSLALKDLTDKRNTTILPLNVFLRTVDEAHSKAGIYSSVSYKNGMADITYRRLGKGKRSSVLNKLTTVYIYLNTTVYHAIGNAPQFLDTKGAEGIAKLYTLRLDVSKFNATKTVQEYILECTGVSTLINNMYYEIPRTSEYYQYIKVLNHYVEDEQARKSVMDSLGVFNGGNKAENTFADILRVLNVSYVVEELNSLPLLQYFIHHLLQSIDALRELGHDDKNRAKLKAMAFVVAHLK